MIVAVGSRNPAKLKAVERAFKRFFKGVELRAVEAEAGVADQPLTLGETVKGAVNRARGAWESAGGKCDYSVGIEAGLFPVAGARTGRMDAAAVAIFDGKRVYLGLTPAFEYPKQVVEKILQGGKNVSDVFLEKWGEDTRDELGAIGRLSNGAVPRSVLQEMGVVMALAPIVNKKYYGEK